MSKNNVHLLAVATIISIFVLGCSWEQLSSRQKPKLEKLTPVNYQKAGIKLIHPEGWSVSEETLDDGERFVRLADRFSSIVTLNIVKPGEDIDLVQSAAISHEEMRKNVPVVGITKPVKENAYRDIAGQNRKGIRYLFEMTVAGINDPHVTDYFVADIGGRNVFITLQAPAEDWPGAEQEFQMILDSIAIGSAED